MSSSEHDVAGEIRNLNLVRLEGAAQAAGYTTHKPGDDELEIRAEGFFLDIYSTEGAGNFLVGGTLECPTDQIGDLLDRIRELLERLNLRFNLEIYEDGDVDRVRPLRDSTRPPTEHTFMFELGSAYAPDSPWGLDRLVLYEDGIFRYENQVRETITKVVGGRVTPEALTEVKRALDCSGFPEVPEHDIAPGAANMAISIGDARAFFGIPEGREFAGYGTLVKTLGSWTTYLRRMAESEGAPLGLVVTQGG